MSDRPLAVLLMGPTASGKTELALGMAARFPCDIISVDSAQVYRGLDIGTAKPGPEVLAATPHRLIDICEPTEAYSAARFRADALREMAESVARGRIPLLVGGTLLYFRALQQGLSSLPEADSELRARLEGEAETLGWAELHRRLLAVDPEAGARIHPHDAQRIQRALEVFELTGRPLSQLQRESGPECPLPYRLLKLVRAPRERAVLRERIAVRFQAMLEAGFEEEVRNLWARGDLTPDLPAMRSVGYRQILNYLLGGSSFGVMIERGVIATRQLAKRQLTWLRAEPDCHWIFDDEDPYDQAQHLLHHAGP
jgi:tRNA dimethylallyltransferase